MIIFPPSIVKSNITKRLFSDIERNFQKGITVIDGVTITKVDDNFVVVTIDGQNYKLFQHSDKLRGWCCAGFSNIPNEFAIIRGEVVDDVTVEIQVKDDAGCWCAHAVEYIKTGHYQNGCSRIYFNFNGKTYDIVTDTSGRIHEDYYQYVLKSFIHDLQTINPFNKKHMSQPKSHYLKDDIVYDFPLDGAVETHAIIVDGKVYTENTSLSINTKPKEEIEKEERLNKILSGLPSDTPDWVKAMISAFAK